MRRLRGTIIGSLVLGISGAFFSMLFNHRIQWFGIVVGMVTFGLIWFFIAGRTSK